MTWSQQWLRFSLVKCKDHDWNDCESRFTTVISTKIRFLIPHFLYLVCIYLCLSRSSPQGLSLFWRTDQLLKTHVLKSATSNTTYSWYVQRENDRSVYLDICFPLTIWSYRYIDPETIQTHAQVGLYLCRPHATFPFQFLKCPFIVALNPLPASQC